MTTKPLGRVVHSTDHYIVHVGITRELSLAPDTSVYLLRNKDTGVDEQEFNLEYWAVLMANELEGTVSTLNKGMTASEYIREVHEDSMRQVADSLVVKDGGLH